MDDTKELKKQLLAEIEGARDSRSLEDLRVGALGKKGRVTALTKKLGAMSVEERKRAGPRYNKLKNEVGLAIEKRRRTLEAEALEARLVAESVDVTLPVHEIPRGRIHPVSQVMDEIAEIFADLGFRVAEGPDIEDDFHNFTALNIPPEHPARQMHDTFYLKPDEDGERKLLRTHTSPVQIRTMQSQKPPIRIIAPGRTYRSDSDATHTPMFHQIEGLVIDEETHMGHLKGCLEAFVKAFFEVDEVRMRFRPSYFPFTEPSAEVDIGCSWKDGQLKIGPGDDWLEILGCGMVNPRVLEFCGLDSERYQGFAFGCGIDRLAMLKYGMTDLRAFFDSDLRWLRHYGFLPLDVPTVAGGLSR
ncbi:MAG: phenylalanine--tRNA ligase subunit alpha [Sphingomonadales bacterium]